MSLGPEGGLESGHSINAAFRTLPYTVPVEYSSLSSCVMAEIQFLNVCSWFASKLSRSSISTSSGLLHRTQDSRCLDYVRTQFRLNSYNSSTSSDIFRWRTLRTRGVGNERDMYDCVGQRPRGRGTMWVEPEDVRTVQNTRIRPADPARVTPAFHCGGRYVAWLSATNTLLLSRFVHWWSVY